MRAPTRQLPPISSRPPPLAMLPWRLLSAACSIAIPSMSRRRTPSTQRRCFRRALDSSRAIHGPCRPFSRRRASASRKAESSPPVGDGRNATHAPKPTTGAGPPRLPLTGVNWLFGPKGGGASCLAAHLNIVTLRKDAPPTLPAPDGTQPVIGRLDRCQRPTSAPGQAPTNRQTPPNGVLVASSVGHTNKNPNVFWQVQSLRG